MLVTYILVMLVTYSYGGSTGLTYPTQVVTPTGLLRKKHNARC